MINASKGTEFEELVQILMEYRQGLLRDINILVDERNKDIEEATWKFAKWKWLKSFLKFIYSHIKKVT
jgi:hypothetical protein